MILAAIHHDLTILHSPDMGETWLVQFQDISSEKPFLDVLFFTESHGIAVGAYGAFYRTRDGGVTWQKELNASLLHPDDQAYLDEIRELDGEEFYLEELASILPHFNRVTFANGILYMVGETGMIAQSQDQGMTWQRIEIDYDPFTRMVIPFSRTFENSGSAEAICSALTLLNSAKSKSRAFSSGQIRPASWVALLVKVKGHSI